MTALLTNEPARVNCHCAKCGWTGVAESWDDAAELLREHDAERHLAPAIGTPAIGGEA